MHLDQAQARATRRANHEPKYASRLIMSLSYALGESRARVTHRGLFYTQVTLRMQSLPELHLTASPMTELRLAANPMPKERCLASYMPELHLVQSYA
ncbi:hypothetical protein B296_00005041 [Ensete ventricosum]|uniref:Uncharacterized protein n=1 Tax=Ensete ventricosum TaxID=4639 RepID=A0A427BA95_ENSVE|nr:hypothetical protein B296_00005041 [Ensete ventricosum]